MSDYQDDGGLQWWQTVQQQENIVGFMLKKGGGGEDFAPLPEGGHPARCVQFVTLGTQRKEWQGQVKEQFQVRITWEIPGERMANEDKPMVISKTYTASLGEKANLRKDLEAWRGKKFTEAELDGWDASQLLGKACLIGVVHTAKDGKTYANINSLMPLPKGMVCPPQENPSVFFTLENFDPQVFDGLSKYVKEQVAKSPEYAEATGRGARVHQPADDIMDDEIPF